MPDIFLSYASADRDRARQLADALTRRGYSVWWDRTIPPGRVFDEVIQEAILAARCMIVLWSADSVRSNWVKTEAAEGVARGILVPARLGDVVPPIEFKRIQAADITHWTGDENNSEYRQLIGSVERLMSRPKDAAKAPVQPIDTHSAGRSASRSTLFMVFGFGVLCALLVVGAFFLFDTTAPDKDVDAAVVSGAGPSSSGTVADTPAPATRTSPARQVRINLLAPDNGGQLLVASTDAWNLLIDGREDSYVWTDTGFGVFGFQDDRTALIDTFTVLVPREDNSNLKDFELLVATAGPTGPFQSIGRFSTANLRMIRAPYQEFHFPAVQAKYLKVRSLTSHGGTSTAAISYEIQLFGELQ